MRPGTLKLLLVFGAVATVLFFMQHILQLFEVVRTYATFHSLVRTHPDLLYRYPETIDGPVVVPKILHYVVLGDAELSKYDDALKSCRDLHKDWKYEIWTDETADQFLADNYPDILPHYKGYHQNIQRANVLRYALLHKFGGVYLDLDVSCLVALDSTSLLKLPFVSPGAHPAGVNNAFIAAQPGHPFLGSVLEAVPSHDMFWGIFIRIPYVENMLSTGCMFYTNMWMAYVRSLLAGSPESPVHILADETGDMKPHMLRGKIVTPIFAHGGASSWHSWDAAILLTIGKNYTLFVSVLGVTAVAEVAQHDEIKDC
ncbi:nucleotide-diphospho-sugar transferase [Stachybotrys elegans]|uniref:Nucleotide-diphospho-sugar transferase n=1 Tax=Stachybotrys elegans TaxID=80388 RepID=A0A8K0STC7_9HYPO|nr:nucleotide-diphospho-sugar transferase [Stachybotrys elegans]